VSRPAQRNHATTTLLHLARAVGPPCPHTSLVSFCFLPLPCSRRFILFLPRFGRSRYPFAHVPLEANGSWLALNASCNQAQRAGYPDCCTRSPQLLSACVCSRASTLRRMSSSPAEPSPLHSLFKGTHHRRTRVYPGQEVPSKSTSTPADLQTRDAPASASRRSNPNCKCGPRHSQRSRPLLPSSCFVSTTTALHHPNSARRRQREAR
jgi:hypothetical protein